MSWTKRILASLAVVLVAWLVAPEVYARFAGIRVKAIQAALPSTLDHLEVPIPTGYGVDRLQTPFAAIVRLHNDGTVPLVVTTTIDGREMCAVEIPAGASQRADCAVRGSWIGGASHRADFTSTRPGFTLEYFELATHHGALSVGPSNLIVVPRGFAAFQPAGFLWMIVLAALMTLSVLSVADGRLPKVLSIVHRVSVAIAGLVLVLVIVLRFASPYSLVIAAAFLAKLLGVAATPALVRVGASAMRWLHQPRIVPQARVVTVGLLVGAVFFSFARTRAADFYGGHPSGLLLVSQARFDSHPILSMRDDIRSSLRLSPDGGYDGQFFYFMTFDPFLKTFRKHPERYREFIDFPPYRYGRIGFSLLTRVASGNRPTRYPITMVALVVGSLGLCAALLGALAQGRGLSSWYGALILLVPGFWQSVEGTLPEPLAVALILAAYLLARHERWWACGVSLAMSLLIRETSGALVLALPAGIWLIGKRRESLLVAVLTFAPLALWKLFVGSVFYGEYGTDAFMPHPADFGPPFAGVWHMWMKVADGSYFDGMHEMARAGAVFPILSTSAIGLAAAFFIRRPGAVSAAAAAYALLTVFFNYDAVWLHIGNAQRLTIDLFVALALVFAVQAPERRVLTRPMTVFWSASALYMCFGTFEATAIRHGAVDWIGRWFGWS